MKPNPSVSTKSDRIHLRVSKSQKALIAQAASSQHKDVSEFILESVIKQAEEAILDQRLFILSDEDLQELEKQIAEPAVENPNLTKLLATRAPWEK
jgi:uncharacterized protein (DUF1778 family)